MILFEIFIKQLQKSMKSNIDRCDEMKLYIDFDGVILDSIPVIFKILEKTDIDETDEKELTMFYENLDWNDIIKKAPQIHHSVSCIKKIIASKKFDVAILTHVNSQSEILEKVAYLKKELPGITIISVPKQLHKTDMVNPKGAILIDDFTGNLVDWDQKGGISIKFSLVYKDRGFPVIDRLDMILDMKSMNRN